MTVVWPHPQHHPSQKKGKKKCLSYDGQRGFAGEKAGEAVLLACK